MITFLHISEQSPVNLQGIMWGKMQYLFLLTSQMLLFNYMDENK